MRSVLGCLLGLGGALLIVGVVSGTVLRHVVQIVPLVAAAGVLMRRPMWGAYAALPIFLFWIVIVVLIWLFLLGIARIATGHFTPVEILLTMFMAGFSSAGVFKSIALGRPLRPVARVIACCSFAAFQVGAMWVSLLQPLANR